MLRETIASVLGQTYRDLELLVMDNRSSDDTEKAVASFDDPRVRFHRNDANLGMVGNWNRGVSLSRGEYVAILHDDDAWEPGFLHAAVAALDEHPSAGFVATSTVICDATLRPLEVRSPWGRSGILRREEALPVLAYGNRFFCPAILVRASAYREAGEYRESVKHAADWDMWIRILLRHDVALVDAPLVRYRTGHGSASDRFAASAEGIRSIEADTIQIFESALRQARDLGDRAAVRAMRRGLAHRHALLGMWEARVGHRLACVGGVARAVRTDPSTLVREPRTLARALAALAGR